MIAIKDVMGAILDSGSQFDQLESLSQQVLLKAKLNGKEREQWELSRL